MRPVLLTILLFCLRLSGFSQNDSSDFIIGDAIRSLNVPNTIIYIDSSMNYYTTLGEIEKNGCIVGRFDTSRAILCLSKREFHFLDKEFKKQESLLWRGNMFGNSIRMSYDSLKFWRAKIKSSLTFDPKIDTRYFSFSRILYLRNHSIAFFRLAEWYGNSWSGDDYIFIYVKKSNIWHRHMLIDMGAW